MSCLLSVDHLGRSFDGVNAVNDLSFDVGAGEVLAVVGPNGSGKTTLLNLLSGGVVAHQGHIRLGGEDLTLLPPCEVACRGVARSFQHPRLFPRLTALENVAIAAGARGEGLLDCLLLRWQTAERQRQARAARALDAVGLLDMQHVTAGRISFGQMKRVELARLLVDEDTRLVLIDEPLSGLDPPMVQKALAIIARLRSPRRAIIVVEHNLVAVARVADRMLLLEQGRKAAEGQPGEVLASPLMRSVAVT